VRVFRNDVCCIRASCSNEEMEIVRVSEVFFDRLTLRARILKSKGLKQKLHHCFCRAAEFFARCCVKPAVLHPSFGEYAKKLANDMRRPNSYESAFESESNNTCTVRRAIESRCVYDGDDWFVLRHGKVDCGESCWASSGESSLLPRSLEDAKRS
jgi:hypothetical protein